MSLIHYLGLLLLSLSWLWALPIYGQPHGFPFLMVIAALVLLSFSPRSLRFLPGSTGGQRRLPHAAGLLLIPVVMALFVLPGIFTPGLLLLAVAITAGILRGEGEGIFKPVTGWLLAGSVLVLQAALLPLLAVLSGHIHAVPLIGYILYPFIRLFDASAAVSGGNIYMFSMEDIYGFGVTAEKLAFLPLALYFTAAVISRIFNGDTLRVLVRTVIVFLVYAAIRFMAVFFTVILAANERLFWNPSAIFWSLIPLVFALAWIIPLGGEEMPDRTKDRKRISGMREIAPAALIAAVAVMLLAGSLLFHDPGSRKSGRVLFDEHYSDWEWSTQKYDRNWYGSKSGYNYYSLFEFITGYFDVVRGHERISPAYLAQFDVVIIKTPTKPFTAEEISMLTEFVENGGGLFLIGDHTNVFGTSTNLNPLAARFGLRFNYDSTYQLHTMALSNYSSPPVAAHPVMQHVPDFFFATSCSMDSPIFGENVIIGYNLKGMMLDYSQRSYFPKKEERNYEFGFLMQMAGVKHGKGRVLGFTDSTCFSNFFMFIPGKPELFLGSLDWLNRANKWRHLNIVFFIVGIAAAVLSARLLRGSSRLGACGTVLFGIVTGLLVAVPLFESMKAAAYPPVQPKKKMKTIAFEREHSRNDMPIKSLVRNREQSLHTFYVWTQRLDFVPSLEPTLEEALEKSDIVVVANPMGRLDISEIDAVVDFIRGGGNLLLLIEPRNRASTARDLLGIFRMRVGTAVADTTEILNTKGERISIGLNVGEIYGGIPLLTQPGGKPVFAYDKLGEGRFFAFSSFYTFSQALSGPTSVTPNRMQREVFELEFQILEILQGEREPSDIRPFMQPVAPAGRPSTQ
jgi:hypothetical protein